MKKIILFIAIFITAVVFVNVFAQSTSKKSNKVYQKSDVDYRAFSELTEEAEAHRNTHMVSLVEFKKLATEKGTMILDTRSKAAYDKKHIKGAVHLNFSDFTQGKLAKVIPTLTTKVLIYCNNNIDKDEMYFARKSTPLALNIPTFINLYGYGYKNIYELDALVQTTSLEFEGTSVIKEEL